MENPICWALCPSVALGELLLSRLDWTFLGSFAFSLKNSVPLPLAGLLMLSGGLLGCVALYSFKHLTRLFWVVPSSVLLTLQSASFLITIPGAHPFFHFYFFFGLTFAFILADYVTFFGVIRNSNLFLVRPSETCHYTFGYLLQQSYFVVVTRILICFVQLIVAPIFFSISVKDQSIDRLGP